MNEHPRVHPGQTVYAADGARLGRVLQCHESGFVVERGIVFAQDYPVFWDEVLTADGEVVRLRFPACALLREEDAEPWDPPRDPEGTAGGVDLEPLRAGMAEVDEDQARLAAAPAGVAPPPRRTGWAALARLARALGWPAATPAPAPRGAEAPSPAPPWVAAVEELERRIAAEVQDFEQEGGCADPGEAVLRQAAVAAARLQRRLEAAARRDRGGGRRRRRMADGAPGRVDYARADDALAPLRHLEAYVHRSGLEPSLLELVRLRASQLNGCSPCVEVHGEKALRRGVAGERLAALPAWRESALFSPRERAALAWTEAVTRIPASQVEEELFRLARDAFGERGLIDLTMAVVAINGWNRLAVAFGSGLGAYRVAVTPAPSP